MHRVYQVFCALLVLALTASNAAGWVVTSLFEPETTHSSSYGSTHHK